MPPIDGAEALGMGAIVIAVPVIVNHLKQATERKPWPLVADITTVLISLWAFYGGALETATNPAEATLMGLVLSFVAQRGYDVSTATEKRVKATRDALRTAGERVHRYDGVVLEEG